MLTTDTFGGSQLFTRILPPSELRGGRQLYQLISGFSFESARLGLITAPAGMITDFASIPRAAWYYIDPEDPVILYPSAIHDFLYSLGGRLPDARPYSRATADQILIDAMRVCGARADQRAIVYRMVRLFGGSKWGELASQDPSPEIQAPKLS